jgi:23S rRNA pseudouridine2605 synthase
MSLMSLVSPCELCYQARNLKSRFYMPRDDDRKHGGRPPGRGPGRGGPPRGKRFAGGDKRAPDDRPREPRKIGGRAYRKAHGDAPRDAARDERTGGKRFGGGKPGERKFGDKRPYGSRPGGGFRKDGERPRRAFDRGDGRPRGERGERPKFDRPREDRPARSAERDRGPRRFDRPKFDSPRGERGTGDRPSSERPFREVRRDDRSHRDRSRSDRPTDKRPRDHERGPDRPRFSRDRGRHAANDGPHDERRRNDRVARSAHAWRDHPRSETASPSPDRRNDGGEREPRREFQQRPAFGGRGAYRERKPFSRDSRERRDAAPPKKSGERIAKLMARAGLCSRREAEEWIRQGRVVVNGRVIDSPALDIVERDIVAVDGAPLPQRERTRMFLYHKPRGLVTTHSDPEGRPTIFDNLPKNLPRLISIGRLDYNTEGLLLLTNDGGLKRVLELPDTGWLRRYRVRAHGAIAQAQLDTLREGIEVDGVKYGPIEATLDSEQGANVWLTFAIREGKNREVRNVLAALGLEVNRLIRVSYGPFQLGELGEGEVSEVRGRMLRDQLGERIAKQAGADFSLPVRDYDEGDEEQASVSPREESRGREPRRHDERPKPKGRAGLIADSKGRRVLVQRVGGDERDRGQTRPRRPAGRYKGKRDRDKQDE